MSSAAPRQSYGANRATVRAVADPTARADAAHQYAINRPQATAVSHDASDTPPNAAS